MPWNRARFITFGFFFFLFNKTKTDLKWQHFLQKVSNSTVRWPWNILQFVYFSILCFLCCCNFKWKLAFNAIEAILPAVTQLRWQLMLSQAARCSQQGKTLISKINSSLFFYTEIFQFFYLFYIITLCFALCLFNEMMISTFKIISFDLVLVCASLLELNLYRENLNTLWYFVINVGVEVELIFYK